MSFAWSPDDERLVLAGDEVVGGDESSVEMELVSPNGRDMDEPKGGARVSDVAQLARHDSAPEPEPDGDTWVGSAHWLLWPARVAGVTLLVFVGFAITTGGAVVTEGDRLAVALAALASVAVVRGLVFLGTEYVLTSTKRYKARDQYPMVGWLRFSVILNLVRMGVRGLTLTDARKREEIRAGAAVHDERSGARLEADGRFFFDLVADTGDGFNSTFTVANLLGRGELTVTERREDGERVQVTLPRPSVLLHGGDICYPTFTREDFVKRFLQPYMWAFPQSAATPQRPDRLYFAAGNHEHIDGLQGFRQHLLPRPNVGGWRTPQTGSYFAVTLPHDWVVFVVDLGPEPEDIDEPQQRWFDAQDFGQNPRVILLYHVPDWIKCGSLGFSIMGRLRRWRAEMGDKVKVVLAGDLHYYRRMEEMFEGDVLVVRTPDSESARSAKQKKQTRGRKPAAAAALAPTLVAADDDDDDAEPPNCSTTTRRQYVVAGNGGAYGHATHFPATLETPLLGEGGKRVRTMCDFPSVEASERAWRQGWPWVFLPFSESHTNGYTRVLGSLYMFLFFAVSPLAYVPGEAAARPGEGELSLEALASAAFGSAFFYAAAGFMLVLHYVLVTANFDITTAREIGTVLLLVLSHTAVHLVAALLMRLSTDAVLLPLFGAGGPGGGLWEPVDVAVYCVLANLAMYLLGHTLGSFISTVYFYLSVELAHWHYNEAIALLQLEDFKGFVRLAILPSGDLEIYSIVTDTSPNNWESVPRANRSHEQPAIMTSSDLKYYLLEKVTLDVNGASDSWDS